ncbi:MAG: pyruvate dehydrogenase (acetyl-transferring) E1 component subunit alpha, partial [Microbacterium gubbeenense]
GSEFFADVDQEGEALAADVRTRIAEWPDPDPASMFAHVYSEPHALMEQQAAWLAEYEASFEGGAA